MDELDQPAIDKAAFLKEALLPYEPDKGSTRPYIKDVDGKTSKELLDQIQEMAWNAAIKWERESPDSLSSKRIQELKKILE